MDRKSKFITPFLAASAPCALAVAALINTASPAMAQSGRIDTLPLGHYECTLPGSASGPAWRRVPGADFAILNSSSYVANGQRGIYLLRGKRVTFTAGPMRGQTMERTGQRILRARNADGSLDPMRCVRTGPAD